MRWFTWLMPVLGVVVLVLGYVISEPQVFQISTGWIGFFSFLAAFFVLLGMETLFEEYHA
jgi:hypothetical protein